MEKTLGIDLGPNSIGWALIDIDNEEIIDSGVRIFEEGLNRNGGKEESKNATRRDARQSRRMNARQKARLRRLSYILKNNDMMPTNDTDLNLFFKLDPYYTRSAGVKSKLSLHEFGRSLYHINQRRGFKSNKKSDAPTDTGKIFDGKDDKTGINETSDGIINGGFKTLGQYLHSLNPHHKRQRNRYTLRAMYIDEFNILWNKQAEFYPELFREPLKKDLFDSIFYQRKLKSQRHLVRHCTFEPKKKVSPKSSLIFQDYRIAEQLSRIRISYGERENEILTESEREILANLLNTRSSITFDQLKKKLSFPEEAHINLQSQNKLKGNSTQVEFRKVFGVNIWDSFSEKEKHDIWQTLHYYNDPPDNEKWLQNHAKKKWGLNIEQIDKLLKIKLEKDYCNLSHKAMAKILPLLKQQFVTDEQLEMLNQIHKIPSKSQLMTYDKAVALAGYHHSQLNKNSGTKQRLPVPDNLRNPIVQQALHEVRHVVNQINDVHGKPDVIKVELTRDTKNPKWKRNGLLKLNSKRNKENEAIKGILIEQGISQPSRTDIIKYRLWEECNKTCPFTGKRIPFSGIFGEGGNEFQIEHIIPYSRSLDDSQANKTLCHWKTNQIKHNKTPFEAFGHNEQHWEEILDRVFKFRPTDGITRVTPEIGKIEPKWGNKLRKFKLKNIDEKLSNEFVARQLVDTAYISREVTKYLSNICEKVYTSSGKTTSTLRYHWGLNEILSGNIEQKQREDHRHHAVDAIVIALTSHSYVQTMSRFHKYDCEPGRGRFPIPWSSFWVDAKESVNKILISHKVNNRARGQLHKDTNYGQIILPNGEKGFVVRKQLNALTPKEITNIVDPIVKQLILSHLKSLGVDTSQKSFSIPKGAFDTSLHLPNNPYPIRKVRIIKPSTRLLKLYPDRNLFVEYGTNHHIELFENEDGKRDFRICSLYDAVQRQKNGKPTVNQIPPKEGYSFLMSLAINELVLLDVEPNQIDWNKPPSSQALGSQLFRVQKMDKNGILTFRHHTVSIVSDDTGRVIKNFSTFKGMKIIINELGQIRPA